MADYQLKAITKMSSPLELVLHLPMTFPRYRDLLLSLGPESPALVVEARCNERLVGVGLAVLRDSGGQGEILSIFVASEVRGQGLGTQLLAMLEQILATRSATSARLSYQTGQTGTEALECILRKRQWSEPETALIVCTATGESIKTAPWLTQRPLHQDFSLFMWTTLSETERQAIRDKQRNEAWYPELVSPFIDEALIAPESSIGLRHNASSDIAGWMITHRIGPRTVRFSSQFVSPPYRFFDLGTYLIVKAIKLQFDSDKLTTGKWYFQPDNKTTNRFTQRSLRPYLTGYDQIKHSTKTLSV